MREQMDFDTLLKFINELSDHIDLDAILRDAEAFLPFAFICITFQPHFTNISSTFCNIGCYTLLLSCFGTTLPSFHFAATCVALFPFAATCAAFFPFAATCVAFFPFAATCAAFFPYATSCVALTPQLQHSSLVLKLRIT
ncbi:hypothetical protein SLEP1_g36337 [Rubroshorea leprosula]|uniref:Uncharacterized protein n=1 Tax=Rubroshorea leprosula TaxID=152421 RepID=A0AAV5KR58_9ROSI|nr:hypothetical protein SLEP1_g36337 [Rubroshorea leprosula]